MHSTSMHVFRAAMKQKAVCMRALHVSRGTVGVLAEQKDRQEAGAGRAKNMQRPWIWAARQLCNLIRCQGPGCTHE